LRNLIVEVVVEIVPQQEVEEGLLGDLVLLEHSRL